MFSGLLTRAGLRKIDLSRRLGVSANTVTAWGENAPRYAIAYLELLIEYNRIRP